MLPEPPVKLMEKPVELSTVQDINKSMSIKLNDESPSGIPLSVVIKSVTTNYTTCNAYREQIFGLQEWITKEKASSDKP